MQLEGEQVTDTKATYAVMRLDLYIRIPKYQSRFHLNSKRIGIDLHSISYTGLFKMFSGWI